MAMELFSAEYKALKEVVANEKFDEPLRSVMAKMKDIFGVDGFDSNCQAALDLMRGLLFVKENERILASAGINPSATQAPPIEGVMKAAAIKFLCHLYDKVLWTITVIHEITHLDVSTHDLRYDYEGLKPGPMFDPDDAAENADSWAYFCADCAGALTRAHIQAAMAGW